MNLESICLCVVMVIFCLCITSDSPYSEHGTLDEVDHDGGTEAHTSEDGMIFLFLPPHKSNCEVSLFSIYLAFSH